MRSILRAGLMSFGLTLMAMMPGHNIETKKASKVKIALPPQTGKKLALTYNLPDVIGQRVRALYSRGFDVCSEKALELARPYVEVGMIPPGAGIEEDSINCYVALWQALTGRIISGNNAEAFIARMIVGLGYKIKAEEVPYHVAGGRIVGFDFRELDRVLKPGDVLLYYGSTVFTNIKHAALYLGQLNGRHYVFQKPGMYCGSFSPYEIVTLNESLGDSRGEVFKKSLFQKIFIYRR